MRFDCTQDLFYCHYREKEEDEALEQARQIQEQEHAKQLQKMKIERMREAERRRREAVSTANTVHTSAGVKLSLLDFHWHRQKSEKNFFNETRLNYQPTLQPPKQAEISALAEILRVIRL